MQKQIGVYQVKHKMPMYATVKTIRLNAILKCSKIKHQTFHKCLKHEMLEHKTHNMLKHDFQTLKTFEKQTLINFQTR